MQMILEEMDLDEWTGDHLSALTDLVEEQGRMAMMPTRDAGLPLDMIFPARSEHELDRIRLALGVILVDGFGMDRAEVYSVLFADGGHIHWN